MLSAIERYNENSKDEEEGAPGEAKTKEEGDGLKAWIDQELHDDGGTTDSDGSVESAPSTASTNSTPQRQSAAGRGKSSRRTAKTQKETPMKAKGGGGGGGGKRAAKASSNTPKKRRRVPRTLELQGAAYEVIPSSQ